MLERGQERGERREIPHISLWGKWERAALGGGGRLERAGLKKLEGFGAAAGTGVATLEPGAGSYKICFGVCPFLSKLNWEALAWRQKGRASAGLGSADENGWRLG